MPADVSYISLRDANVELIDCDHRTPPPSDSGYPYVAIPQLRDGRIQLSEARRIKPEHYVAWTKKAKPEAHDVVLSRRCNPGETAVVESGMEFALGQNLVLLRADGTWVYPPYLRWLVRSPQWWEQVWKFINVGAVFDSLRCADIPNFELPIPPLSEQRVIERVLGNLDDKIALNRRMNGALEAMARAIFKSWFVDFDPVRAKAEGRQPFGMDAATASLFPNSFQDSSLGKVPEGWKVPTLNDCLTALETGSRPKGGITGIHEGVPSIGAESIVGIGTFDFAKTKLVSREFFAQMKRGHVSDGDVLLYKDGGRPGEYEPHVTMVGDGFPFREFCINEHVYRIRTAPALPQAYLYFWLTSDTCMDEMRNRGTGVAVPGLNSTSVRELALLVPSERALGKFSESVGPLIKRIFLNCNESKTLAAIRDALLPKLVSGEIRVKGAANFVEELAQ